MSLDRIVDRIQSKRKGSEHEESLQSLNSYREMLKIKAAQSKPREWTDQEVSGRPD